MNLRIREFRNLKDIDLPLEGVVQVVGPPGCGRSNLEAAFRWLVEGGDEPGWVSLGDIARRNENGLQVSGAGPSWYEAQEHLMERLLGAMTWEGWPDTSNVSEFCGLWFSLEWQLRISESVGDVTAHNILDDLLYDDPETLTIGGRLQLKIDKYRSDIERSQARLKATPEAPTEEAIADQLARVDSAKNDVDRATARNGLRALEQAKVDSAKRQTLEAGIERLERRLCACERLLKAVDTVEPDGYEERTLWKVILKDARELIGMEFTKAVEGEVKVDGRGLGTLSSTERQLWDLVVKAHCLASIKFPYLFLDLPAVPDYRAKDLFLGLVRAFRAIVIMYPCEHTDLGDLARGAYYWLESGRLESSGELVS